jgi:hypothetical protein
MLNCDLLYVTEISLESIGSPSARKWCCMYQFEWPLCKKKCSIGFSVMLQNHRWERRFVKVLTTLSCIMQWYKKPTGDDCLQEVWPEGTVKQWNCCNSYLGQVLWCAVEKQKFWKYYWFTPLTTISIQTADNCLLPLLFLRSTSILSCWPIINIHSYHQDVKFVMYWTHGITSTYWVSLLLTFILSLLWLLQLYQYFSHGFVLY